MLHKKHRESWKSKIGFIFAALGSAVGLGSIWRFPYVVGENGGAIFIVLYLICLVLIGFPVLIAEILIGRTTQMSPFGAFDIIGKAKRWAFSGKMTIVTGFIISSFYSVIAGWMLGYLIQALSGNLNQFQNPSEALSYFQALSSSPLWTIGFHFLFILLSICVLFSGVRNGIEAGSKVMMPLLILVLLFLVFKGLTMDGAKEGLTFLFSPDWNEITPKAILMALGQAFFTLSLGQGTMVTYGSYLSKKEDITGSCIPVVILNTVIALLMGVAIFTIVFSVGMTPESGTALIFETLPIVFSQVSWGWALSILFFFLIVLAALTSEISALEPAISFLIDEKNMSRKRATLLIASGAFILGIPTCLSFNLIKNQTLFGANFFEIISFISINILVPVGGLLAVLLVSWRWGMKNAFKNLGEKFTQRRPILAKYFFISMKYTAPALILLILLDLIRSSL